MATELVLPAVSADPRPLVAHVVYRFDTGGLENGLVNLINHLPADRFRHVVIALTEVTSFAARVRRSDVDFIALHKPPGHALWIYPQLVKVFRHLHPAIVHTRNLAALETVVPAWLAGVPVRIHGEHGRDIGDLHGRERRYQWMRRLYRPLVQRQIALSRDLAAYLQQQIGVPAQRVSQIYNGVDTQRFAPAPQGSGRIPGCPFDPQQHWLVGTVGRMQPVKDQLTLARAFAQVLAVRPELRDRLRLVLVGDGPLRARCEALLREAGVAELAWLPGERSDVDAVLRGLHCFVLPSLAEGISNTILEAMASALPVIATDVGGNADLVVPGTTGELVPPDDAAAMAEAITRMADEPSRSAAFGRAGRAEVERRFSLQAMMNAYRALYESELDKAGVPRGRH